MGERVSVGEGGWLGVFSGKSAGMSFELDEAKDEAVLLVSGLSTVQSPLRAILDVVISQGSRRTKPQRARSAMTCVHAKFVSMSLKKNCSKDAIEKVSKGSLPSIWKR